MLIMLIHVDVYMTCISNKSDELKDVDFTDAPAEVLKIGIRHQFAITVNTP